jgi:preprotein translocase subunit SecA
VGLFSWLFGKHQAERVTVLDRVRLTADTRARAVVNELAEHVAAGRSVLFLAHFPSTLAALASEVLGAGLPHEPISDRLTPQSARKLATGSGPRVLFGLVRNLKPDEFPADEDAPKCPLPVLVAERHFLRRHDDHVTRFAEGLGTHATVTVHMALDDELLKTFTGAWLTDLLKRLGMQSDEAIESSMVARRIRNAQDQIRSKLAQDDEPADSPAEWLRLNVRP